MRVEIVQTSDGGERYELWLGAERVGFSEAKEEGGAVYLPHVFIEPQFRRRDHAKSLVRWQLNDLRAKGKRVVPVCPFVVVFMRRFPEFQDLQFQES